MANNLCILVMVKNGIEYPFKLADGSTLLFSSETAANNFREFFMDSHNSQIRDEVNVLKHIIERGETDPTYVTVSDDGFIEIHERDKEWKERCEKSIKTAYSADILPQLNQKSISILRKPQRLAGKWLAERLTETVKSIQNILDTNGIDMKIVPVSIVDNDKEALIASIRMSKHFASDAVRGIQTPQLTVIKGGASDDE